MFLSRFNFFISFLIHFIFLIFILLAPGFSLKDKEKNHINIINSEIIGLIDQNPRVASKDFENLNSPSNEKQIEKRMTDFAAQDSSNIQKNEKTIFKNNDLQNKLDRGELSRNDLLQNLMSENNFNEKKIDQNEEDKLKIKETLDLNENKLNINDDKEINDNLQQKKEESQIIQEDKEIIKTEMNDDKSKNLNSNKLQQETEKKLDDKPKILEKDKKINSKVESKKKKVNLENSKAKGATNSNKKSNESAKQNEKKKDPNVKKANKDNKKPDSVEQKTIDDLKNAFHLAQKNLNQNALSKDQKNSSNVNTSNNHSSQEMASLGAYIKTKIISCWTIPSDIGLIHTKKVYTIIKIILDKDGGVLNLQVMNEMQYVNNEFFSKIKQSALEAIEICSPIKGLPLERYDEWKEIELVFDPNKI